MEKRFITVDRPTIRRKDLENVLESMVQESLSYGDFAKAFEEKLALKTDSKNVVAINSLFNAFSLVLDALDIKEGDEVIIPSFAPQVYLNVLLLKKIVPKFVDLEEQALRPSVESIKRAITTKTKAILVIFYFGYIFDPSIYQELCANLILDISSVIGGRVNGFSPVKFSTFSIADFSYKNIITTGDGAAIFCDNKKNFLPLISLIEKEYTLEYKPRHKCLISDLNAAMGISQCDSLERRFSIKEQISKFYEDAIRRSHGFSFAEEIKEDKVLSDYPVLVKRSSKEAIKYFKKYSVELARPFEYPLHQYLGLDSTLFPNTENYYLKLLLLPFYSVLQKKDVELICKLLVSFY